MLKSILDNLNEIEKLDLYSMIEVHTQEERDDRMEGLEELLQITMTEKSELKNQLLNQAQKQFYTVEDTSFHAETKSISSSMVEHQESDEEHVSIAYLHDVSAREKGDQEYLE